MLRVTFQMPILINKQGRHGELDAVWKPEFCSLLWKLLSWAWSQKKPCHAVKKFLNWMPAVLPGPEWPNVIWMNDEVGLFYKTFQMSSVQKVILWGLWPSKIFLIVASIKIKGKTFTLLKFLQFKASLMGLVLTTAFIYDIFYTVWREKKKTILCSAF